MVITAAVIYLILDAVLQGLLDGYVVFCALLVMITHFAVCLLEGRHSPSRSRAC